ncbi:unnamed protein product [Orchesella dallaii]|uniref:Uncharacterized protein n=1 Tax=Orchesella dallaii TaxID=48710 RepID=A0ABP1Q8D4_9HEXA
MAHASESQLKLHVLTYWYIPKAIILTISYLPEEANCHDNFKIPNFSIPYSYSTSKFFFVHNSCDSVFEVCFSCCNNFSDCNNQLSKRFVNLTARPLTKPLLQTVTLDGIQSLLGHQQQEPTLSSFNQYSQSYTKKVYRQCEDLRLVFIKPRYYKKVDDCARYLITVNLNCSNSACRRFISLVTSWSPASKMKSASCALPFGVKFLGFKYSVFIEMKNTKPDVNFLSLLQPFGAPIWYCLIVTIGLLSCLLFILETKISSIFWMYSILMEQGKAKFRGGSWKTSKFIVGLWLCSSVAFRHIYTSTVYSFMSAEQEPKCIPTSFEDLVFNSEMDVLSSFDFYSALRESKRSQLGISLKTQKLYAKLQTKLKSVSNDWRAILNISRNEPTKVFDRNNLTMYNIQFNRFSIVSTRDSVQKALIVTFGKRRMLHNNDNRALFETVTMWNVKDNVFIRPFLQSGLSSLIESGIYDKIEEYQENVKIVESLKTVDRKGKFEMSINFLARQFIDSFGSLSVDKGSRYQRGHLNLYKGLLALVAFLYLGAFLLLFCEVIKLRSYVALGFDCFKYANKIAFFRR